MTPHATMPPVAAEQDWMTPDEFNDLYRRLKLIDGSFSQLELARRLEIPQPTISRWLSGARKIEHGMLIRRAMRDLEAELQQERRPKRQRRQQPDGESTGERTS